VSRPPGPPSLILLPVPTEYEILPKEQLPPSTFSLVVGQLGVGPVNLRIGTLAA